jgi:uncharacterized protein
MSGITIKPILGCNMGCTGCYEGEIFRANGNRPAPYDLEAILASARRGPAGMAMLHGGEITLMPVGDMRRLLQALKDDGRTLGLQTNGSLLRDAVVKLLREFDVVVGVSLNGPGELNDDRLAVPHTSMARDENRARTRALTERIHRNVEHAAQVGLRIGIISVLSRTNSECDSHVSRLIEWAAGWGERFGIWDWRWNPLHDDEGTGVELAPERAAAVYERLLDATLADPRRRWNPFREYIDNLTTTKGLQPCWVGPCDPYATEAVWAVLGDGGVGNCLRTAKDGIPYLRSEDGVQHIRQELLVSGDCSGCRWWHYCYGGCPAEGRDGDWRNKSRFCKVYYDTYEAIEKRIQGLFPEWTRVERPVDSTDLAQRSGPQEVEPAAPRYPE